MVLRGDYHHFDLVTVLIRVCDEFQSTWGLESQNLVAITEHDIEPIKMPTVLSSESEVIVRLSPLINKNAIDGYMNFNAGVFAASCGQYTVAGYRFLTCALRQRSDAEAWTNAIVCALNSGDVNLFYFSAKVAHFCLGAEFLPWVLGLMPNSPRVPELVSESWKSW